MYTLFGIPAYKLLIGGAIAVLLFWGGHELTRDHSGGSSHGSQMCAPK